MIGSFPIASHPIASPPRKDFKTGGGGAPDSRLNNASLIREDEDILAVILCYTKQRGLYGDK